MPSALALAAHPDDETYPFGGTLRLLADAGWHCEVAFFSDGERGKRHDGGPLRDTGRARRAEALASCAVLGADAVFHHLPDGGVTAAALEPLRPWLRRRLQDLGTGGVVLSLGADGAYGHPDHVAVFRLVVDEVEATASPPCVLLASFPVGLFLPQYERCLSMMGDPPSPSAEEMGSDAFGRALDIRSVRDAKLAAVAAHRTQLPGGDPHQLFPPGILAALLDEERFDLAGSGALPAAFPIP